MSILQVYGLIVFMSNFKWWDKWFASCRSVLLCANDLWILVWEKKTYLSLLEYFARKWQVVVVIFILECRTTFSSNKKYLSIAPTWTERKSQNNWPRNKKDINPNISKNLPWYKNHFISTLSSTGQASRKKCKERKLLKPAYRKYQ